MMIASLIILAFLIIQKGEIPADSKIGRLLMDLISKVPKLDQSQFDKIMNNTTQVREKGMKIIICAIFSLGSPNDSIFN